jgi:hypothetical protein
MSTTESKQPDQDPTTEQLLTALRTIGISGGSLEPILRRTGEGGGGTSDRWCFWVKNKVVYRDDTPNTPLPTQV